MTWSTIRQNAKDDVFNHGKYEDSVLFLITINNSEQSEYYCTACTASIAVISSSLVRIAWWSRVLKIDRKALRIFFWIFVLNVIFFILILSLHTLYLVSCVFFYQFAPERNLYSSYLSRSFTFGISFRLSLSLSLATYLFRHPAYFCLSRFSLEHCIQE